MSMSVLIVTRNEERDLPGCLDSVVWCDDVHVYDSFSSDGTEAVARAAGAHWVQRPFGATAQAFGGNEAEHRNWGLREIPFRHPWVLMLDADERVTPALEAALRAAVAAPGDCVAFRLRRRDIFMGRWLKHAQNTPYYIRLVRPEKLRYQRRINPVSVVDGPVGQLSGDLDHYPFSKGMSHWLARHNDYSSAEAREIVEGRRGGPRPGTFALLGEVMRAREFDARRSLLKQLFYRAPLRPLIKFLFLYVYKRGFLDGRAGFTYAMLQGVYDWFIVLKTRELEVALEAGRR